MRQGRGDHSLNYGTTNELAAALAARKISALELADHVIARIDALDAKLNAVVVRDFDRGRKAARQRRRRARPRESAGHSSEFRW